MMTPTKRLLLRTRAEHKHVSAMAHAYTLRAAELARQTVELERAVVEEEIATRIASGNFTPCPPARTGASSFNLGSASFKSRTPRTRVAKPATLDQARAMLAKLSDAERAALLTALGL